MLQYYEEEIKQIKAELRSLPKGYLVKRRGFYYCRESNKEKGITRNKKLIAMLARKAYLRERLKRLDFNLREARKFDKRSLELAPAIIIEELSAPYQKLPNSYFFPMYDDRWCTEDDRRLEPQQEVQAYLTTAGTAIGSKSEMLIGNALERREIPYRYEAALSIGSSVLCPNFTIKRRVDGKVFYWVHLGPLEESEDIKEQAQKLGIFASHNIFPGRDLICTCEADIKNSQKIEGLIDLFLEAQ